MVYRCQAGVLSHMPLSQMIWRRSPRSTGDGYPEALATVAQKHVIIRARMHCVHRVHTEPRLPASLGLHVHPLQPSLVYLVHASACACAAVPSPRLSLRKWCGCCCCPWKTCSSCAGGHRTGHPPLRHSPPSRAAYSASKAGGPWPQPMALHW